MKTHNFQRKIYKAGRYLKHHSPTILSFLAATGVVVTSITSIRAASKAQKLLTEAEADKNDKLTRKEIIKITVPIYTPPVLVGMSTIACIFGANILNHKQQATLIGAYALLDKTYKNYKKAAQEIYGEDAESKIKAEMAKKKYVYGKRPIFGERFQLYEPDDDMSEILLFYDSYSERFFNSTMTAVINAQYHVNRNLQLRGFVSINEYYDFLGIQKIKNGDDIGWYIDKMYEQGITWLDFDNMLTMLEDTGDSNYDMECYIISYIYDPEPYEELVD